MKRESVVTSKDIDALLQIAQELKDLGDLDEKRTAILDGLTRELRAVRDGAHEA